MRCLDIRSEALSAVDIATETGISRATAQRYLSQMVDRKIVALELQYGTAGRPINKYRIIPKVT
jgi:response regulator of citrate/malate metabolism